MSAVFDPDYAEPSYYDSCVGACIEAVYEDDESLWLHLSDGSALCFIADPAGGFNIEIHDRCEDDAEDFCQ
jgi:hypothetical protein